MSYTVRLRRSNSTVYTFDATPFVAPKLETDYDDQEPPLVAGVKKTWTLTGILYGASEAATITAYDALAGFFDGTLSQIDGIELLRSGSVVESITTATYHAFKLVSLSSPQSDMQWRGEMRFTMVVEGYKRVATSGTMSGLKQTETWNYDASGLLTITLEGEVEVTTGSATDMARTLGLDPSDYGSDYAALTNGPEYVDVVMVGRDDKKARFRSVIAESGAALPALVSPDFSLIEEEVVKDGKKSTSVTVTALGTGAENAVRSEIPSDATDYVFRRDTYRRTASATIRTLTSADPDTGEVLTVHQTFQTNPGGKRVAWTRRSGGRKPAKQVLSLGPVDVVEDIRVEIYAVSLPPAAEIKFPAPLAGITEDTSRWQLVGPHKSRPAAKDSKKEWVVQVRRVYVAGGLDEVVTPLLQAAAAPGDGASLETEFARQGAPLS